MRDARSCWAMSSSIWLSMKSRYCWRGQPSRSSRAWRICRWEGEERLRASEDSPLSHLDRGAEAKHLGLAQDRRKARWDGSKESNTWGPGGGSPHPTRAQLTL